jgi:hypothetical protein
MNNIPGSISSQPQRTFKEVSTERPDIRAQIVPLLEALPKDDSSGTRALNLGGSGANRNIIFIRPEDIETIASPTPNTQLIFRTLVGDGNTQEAKLWSISVDKFLERLSNQDYPPTPVANPGEVLADYQKIQEREALRSSLRNLSRNPQIRPPEDAGIRLTVPLNSLDESVRDPDSGEPLQVQEVARADIHRAISSICSPEIQAKLWPVEKWQPLVPEEKPFQKKPEPLSPEALPSVSSSDPTSAKTLQALFPEILPKSPELFSKLQDSQEILSFEPTADAVEVKAVPIVQEGGESTPAVPGVDSPPSPSSSSHLRRQRLRS